MSVNKRLRLSFISVILMVSALLVSGCGIEKDTVSPIGKDGSPEIVFRQFTDALLSSPGEGGRKVYFYFEVTRGSGDVDITVEMKAPNEFHDSTTTSFYVEEGVYQLTVVIHGITGGATVHDLSRFEADFVLQSPAAAAKTTQRHMLTGQFHKDAASLGVMTVEPWEPPVQD